MLPWQTGWWEGIRSRRDPLGPEGDAGGSPGCNVRPLFYG